MGGHQEQQQGRFKEGMWPKQPHPSTTTVPTQPSNLPTSEIKLPQASLGRFGRSEGDDFDGVPKLLSRYATWLELYARLDAEERAGAGRERLAALTKEMMEHEEGFLDKYRCLSCWDGGMRDAANDRVEAGQVGVAVFLPLYPRVVSWLQEKLGSYQNVVLAKASR